MGIAQRGSEWSEVVNKINNFWERQDAHCLVYQGHRVPIESKVLLPDRRQMHALNGC